MGRYRRDGVVVRAGLRNIQPARPFIVALETVSCQHVILSQITFKQFICVHCFCISCIVSCCYFSDGLMLLSIVSVRKTVLACLEQVQNIPQLVIKLMVAGSNLSWQGIERKGSVH